MRLVWLAIAWLIGIALGLGATPWRWAILSVWATLIVVALALLWPARRSLLLFLVVACLCCGLGVWRAAVVQHPAALLPAGSITAMRGVVQGWPIRGDGGDTAVVAVDAVRVADRWSAGTAVVQVDLPFAPAVGSGDQIEVAGSYRAREQMTLPTWRDYLTRQGIHGQFRAYNTQIVAQGPRDTVLARKEALLIAIEERLRRDIPGAEGALTTSVLFGDDRLLPPATRQAFVRTGTTHIMALSGWNVALVAGLCAQIGAVLKRGRSVFWLSGSAITIWAFVFFVGASPSLVRAAIMGSLYLVAEALGRRADVLNALALAVIGMTVYAPEALLDIGFQLSCAAVVGLIVAAPLLQKYLQQLRLPKLLGAPIAATIAAELATLPLISHYFGQFSLATLPTNLLVEWPVPLIMGGGFVTALVGFLPGPLGSFFGLLTWLPARAMLAVVETIGSQPGIVRALPPPDWAGVALLYCGLGAMLAIALRWDALRQRTLWKHPVAVSLVSGIVGACIVWGGLVALSR